MRSVFLSYRRNDTADVAGRLHHALRARYGKPNVFMDASSITPGAEFPSVLQAAVRRSGVMLVLIGPEWLGSDLGATPNRLSDSRDWVRREIELAIASGVTIIPVLINGAMLPTSTMLPESLQRLTNLQATALRRDPDFDVDLERLLKKIDRLVGFGKRVSRWLPLFGVALAAGLAWPILVNRFASMPHEKTAQIQPIDTPAPALPALPDARKLERSTRAPLLASNEPVSPFSTFVDCSDVCPEMVALPSGVFTIGAPASEERHNGSPVEGPQKEITVATFAIGRFEITRAQWASFVDETKRAPPESHAYQGICEWRGIQKAALREEVDADLKAQGYNVTSPKEDGLELFRDNPLDPVRCISWEDVQAYLNWLSRRTGQFYRLPSESEWEYAARGGTSSARWFGAAISVRNANYWDSGVREPVEVGSYPANPFGIFDVLGNIQEFTEDCFRPSYDLLQSDGSPHSASFCLEHVVRGGSYFSPAWDVRSAVRRSIGKSYRMQETGFRVVRVLRPGA